MNTKRIVIIVRPSGIGVQVDAKILKKHLEALGHRVDIRTVPVNPEKNELFMKVRRVLEWLNMIDVTSRVHFFVLKWLSRWRQKSDVSIFIESLSPSLLGVSRYNVLLPNQEWFDPNLIPYLRFLDHIWCKSHLSTSIFSSFSNKVNYIGFSSEIIDSNQVIEKNYDVFFHRAGNSLLRGTRRLIMLWSLHPDWPKLVIHMEMAKRIYPVPKNVEYLDNAMDDIAYAEMQAYYGVHIIPSETEGYGLSISEALGYGAIVITTDGAPMNEILDRSSGFLIKAEKNGYFRLAPRYQFDKKDCEEIIESLISKSFDEKKAISERARERYKNNKVRFLRDLSLSVDKL